MVDSDTQMNGIDVSKTLGVLANLGVVGGLIFVGFQLQQDRDIARAALRQQQVDAAMYWAELIDQNSEVWVMGIASEPLTSEEKAEFDAMANALQVTRWVQYSHAQGLLSYDSSRLVRQWALELYQNPGLLSWWQDYQAEAEYVNPNPSTGWSMEVESELARLTASRTAEK